VLRLLRSAANRTPAACFSKNKKQREREINSQAQRAMSFLSIQAHASPAALGCRSHACCLFQKEQTPESEINSQAQRAMPNPFHPQQAQPPMIQKGQASPQSERD
jgi:hypothetical protein